MRQTGMWMLVAAIVLLSGCPKAEADADPASGDSSPVVAKQAAGEANQPANSGEAKEEEPVVIAQTTEEEGALRYHFSLVEAEEGYLFSLTITNTAKTALELTYSSGDTREFTITRGDKTLWSSNEGLRFTQAFQTKELGAGESLEYGAHWGGKVREGEDIGEEPFTIHAEHKAIKHKAALAIEDVTLLAKPDES